MNKCKTEICWCFVARTNLVNVRQVQLGYLIAHCSQRCEQADGFGHVVVDKGLDAIVESATSFAHFYEKQ